MATPNYSYEKRQRELAKKRKKEEKAARKSSGPQHPSNESGDAPAESRGNDTPSGETPSAG